jgi:type IV secretory pathway TraG/TraD family ATPase VirD4
MSHLPAHCVFTCPTRWDRRHLVHHYGKMPRVIGRLSAIVPSVLIGFVAGLVLVAFLRTSKLRWTWALWGAPVAYLAWPIDWKVGLTIALASGFSGFTCAYLHFEDEKRGGAAARAVREHVGVWHVLREVSARRRAASQRVEAGTVKTAGRRVREDRLAIGVNRRRGVRSVPFGTTRGVHGLVLGATGSGKTVCQRAIAQAYVLADIPAIVIDPKGDEHLRETLWAAAQKAGVVFREWAPRGRTVYNPFGRGNPTEVADKALAGHQWSEPHYELATQRLLGQTLAAMRAAGIWPPTLSQIVRYMDPGQLDALGARLGGEIGERVAEYVDGLSERAKADLAGGRNRLAVLAEGELGPRLDPALGDGPPIDFARALSERQSIYMHIDADRYPAASKLLGAAVVIDLVTLTAELQGQGMSGLLVIDEFAALAAEQVHRLFGRARSAGLSLLLGTQSLADLRGARSDDPSDTFTEQVLTNIEYAVVHREADPDSAERLARVAGTRPSWTTTEKVGGQKESWWDKREGTRTPDREFVVLPDEIKRLGVGEAALITPTADPPAEIVRVFPPRGGGLA